MRVQNKRVPGCPFCLIFYSVTDLSAFFVNTTWGAFVKSVTSYLPLTLDRIIVSRSFLTSKAKIKKALKSALKYTLMMKL